MDRTTWDVRNLLEVFSREFTHKDFCLAHLFTDIKFEGGILGLAYVGSPRRNSVGGICTPEYFKNGYTLYLNSGKVEPNGELIKTTKAVVSIIN